MGKFKNLIGMTFGRLTVVEKTNRRTKNGNIYWKCICSCKNNIKVICGSSLLSGNTQSCGCLKVVAGREQGKKAKRFNIYLLNEDYGIGHTKKNEFFYFDLEDYDRVKDYCWVVSKAGYIVAREVSSGKVIYLHRLIMNVEKTIQIDHINRIKSDNRKCNLRTCLQSENSRNINIHCDNTSGFIGVVWDKENNKWIAQIMVDGTYKKIGRYEKIEDAIINRLVAEKKYFKEYAPQKHLFEKYGL